MTSGNQSPPFHCRPEADTPASGECSMLPEDAKASQRDETSPVDSRPHLRSARFFDQASDAIFVFDDACRYVDVNRSACEMLGYTREEVLARSVADMIPAE